MKRILAFLLLASCAVAGTWIASPGKGSHASAAGFTASSATWAEGSRLAFSSSAVTMRNDGKVFTASFWVSLSSTTGFQYVVAGRNSDSGPLWRIRQWEGFLDWTFMNSSSTIVVAGSVENALTVGNWKHVLISFDTSSTSNRAVYINDVAQTVDWTTYTVNQILALDRTDLYVGNNDGFEEDLLGCIAQLWVDDTYNDLSNATFRHAFISSGNPVDLGSTGNVPTGSAPDLYMKFTSGSLGVNSGADGGTATNISVTDGTCGTVVAE